MSERNKGRGAKSSDASGDVVLPSILVDETFHMDRALREKVQEGHRRYARVHAREHQEPLSHGINPEQAPENDMLANPWLQSQRFDGIDPNLNPEPPLNSEARREFDNERREQELAHRLALGLVPGHSKAPRPGEA